MAVKKPDFAVDMTPLGVNLWQRGRSGDWLGLGFVSNTADNFIQAVEGLRMNAARQGRNSAEIRVAKSEVYFTRIKAGLVPDKPTDQTILALIADRIPFQDKAARMIVDTCQRGSGDLAVAVVPAKVLETAAEFAQRHGFEPSYFTTLNNPMMFPAEPRFRLAAPARQLPALKPAPGKRNSVALAAGIVFATLGLALAGQALFTASAPVDIMEDGGGHGADAYPLPASATLTELQLQLPGAIGTGGPGPTPAFATDIAAPQSLPVTPMQIAVAPEGRIASINRAQRQPRKATAPATVRTSAIKSGHERSGLANRTRLLLNNTIISIEEPAEGELGRKTIRILPSDLGRGSYNRRFDPQTFVRVAQANTANDASAGLPAVDNKLLLVTEDGVPLFEGAPSIVPPPRPNAEPAAADDGLKAFSDGIAEVLDGPDATGTDVSGIRIQKASLSTIRPRPNPFRKQEDAPAVRPDSAYPIKIATASTLRPKPRPASLIRRLQQKDIEAATEQAAKEAIRETMPTANALFVSLLPKPRPDNMQGLVERTKPGLTSTRTGSSAVVRTVPTGGGQSSGTMKNSDTPKSVAALATESARIPKHSLSLIGIFGTSSARRALLRLPSGRYIKVKQGDDVSGWKVSAIGESSVRIKKGSRDEVLRMPE